MDCCNLGCMYGVLWRIFRMQVHCPGSLSAQVLTVLGNTCTICMYLVHLRCHAHCITLPQFDAMALAVEQVLRGVSSKRLLDLKCNHSLIAVFRHPSTPRHLYTRTCTRSGSAYGPDNYTQPMNDFPNHQPGDWRELYQGHPCYTPGVGGLHTRVGNAYCIRCQDAVNVPSVCGFPRLMQPPQFASCMEGVCLP